MQAKLPRIRYLLTGLLVAMCGSFHYGYQVTVLNPIVTILTKFIHNYFFNQYDYRIPDQLFGVLLGFIFGLNNIGAVVGSIIFYHREKHMGRKSGLLLGCGFISIGCSLLILAIFVHSIGLFCFGRFICGIGTGLGIGFQTLYLSEISPVKYRGSMGILTGFTVQLGISTGKWLGFGSLLGSFSRWYLLFVVELIAILISFLFLLFFAFESPTYLYTTGCERLARKVVKNFNDKDENALENWMMAIRTDIRLSSSRIGLVDMLAIKSLRKAIVLTLFCNLAVPFSGLIAWSYLGTFLLVHLGFGETEASFASGIAGTCSIFSSILGILLIDRISRKKLMLVSVISLIVINCLLMTTVLFDEMSQLKVSSARWPGLLFALLLSTFFFVFGLGLGPISWFIGTELAPLHARGPINSLAIGTRYLFGFLSSLMFLPLRTLVGAYSFLLFIVPSIGFVIFFYIFLPETNDRTIDQVVATLDNDGN